MQTNLRDARRKAGLTLQALAALSGVDYSTISRLERGKQAPSHHTAQALERALGRKPGSIVFPKLEASTAVSDEQDSTVSPSHKDEQGAR